MPRLPALVLALASITTLHATARADWYDGPPANSSAFCGFSGQSNFGTVTQVGYYYDPVNEVPQIGQQTYIHAVATNTNCVLDDASFEFFLPSGASLAISAETPVQCFSNDGFPPFCPQTPTMGPNGGIQFGSGKTIGPGAKYEVQVPVRFSQVNGGGHVRVHTTNNRKNTDAIVTAIVPYQPPVPQTTRGQDLVLIGGSYQEAGTLPVAFTNDNGTFTVTNHYVGDFAAWSRAPGVQRVSGDFNRDGRTDFALVGGPGWNTIPVAMSNGNGMFNVTNHYVGEFGTWAATANVKALAGDFNRDGHTDIALVGGAGWGSIPIAFSARGGGNGAFEVTNMLVGEFATWAASSGVRPLVGDFNKDGMSDIALVGGAGWASQPVAFSYGNGTFNVTNSSARSVCTYDWHLCYWNFATASREPGVQALVGDFNKDGYSDIALVGGAGWTTIKTAISYGNGTFSFNERPVGAFGGLASTAGVKILAGDFNKDGFTDLALTGVSGWDKLPVASANTNGFTVSNEWIGDFAMWASWPNVRAIAGDFNGDGFSDIALAGGSGWGTIPVALGVANGRFAVINAPAKRFPNWARDTSATLMVGNVNY